MTAMFEEPVRLNRYLAACSLGSRRSVETLIDTGRVAVNGVTATAPAVRIGPEDTVTVDSAVVTPAPPVYLAVNKPAGVVCAVRDRFDPTVLQLLPDHLRDTGVFPVGRLDRESEGLLLLTNDGQCAQRILHPSRGMRKHYRVRLRPAPDRRAMEALRRGCTVEGSPVRPVKVEKRNPRNKPGWVEIELAEGRKREIRVLASQAGLEVERLIRTGIGGMRLRTLRSGQWCGMSEKELWKKLLSGGIV
ncbi:MAG: rRNA pseudouridine synthase [Synergistales bacterium]|nr:rRNA pseudouridine synthase [Synergistales bacterium]